MDRPQKPGDHPEFFRFPAPEGRSRESSIRLDASGRFWHQGQLVDNPRMARAFSSWIKRHPDDGRFILENGYDWTYFTVEDVPYLVTSLVPTISAEGQGAKIVLSDGSDEPLSGEGLSLGAQGAVYCRVKGGAFEARFTPSAQTSLEPLLVAGDTPDEVSLRLENTTWALPLRNRPESAKRGP